jgi:hypothetical protein
MSAVPNLNLSAPTGPSAANADRYQVVQVFGSGSPLNFSELGAFINGINYSPQNTGYVIEGGERQTFSNALNTPISTKNWVFVGALVLAGVFLYARSR